MAGDHRDDDLGMSRPITRRDFLNGAAASTAALAAALAAAQAEPAEGAPAHPPHTYPPARTGLRGDTDGSFTQAHRLRDGLPWEGGACSRTGEHYDLVVVGAGLSGLAAAWFYRKQAGPNARILLIDNHEDFGGHAIRNEFRAGGRLLLSYGGTQSLESPGRYSKVAKGLLRDLGIDVRRFETAFDQSLYDRMRLGTGVFFDRQTFGRDALVTGAGSLPWPQFLARCPLSEAARRDIARLYAEKVDPLPGLSARQKREKLAHVSYADFLVKICKATPDVLPFFQTFSHDLFCVGIDAVSALECFESGTDYGLEYPGMQALGLEVEDEDEPYIYHFPDGNASVARMLVRALIPGAIEGHTMEDVVTARADYSRLDRKGSPVRLRLESTVVRARHDSAGRSVEVTYVRGGRMQSVQAERCVLACHNIIVPHLCPELPQAQRQALSTLVRAPLVYTHVAVRSWAPFQKLGIRQIAAPGGFHSYTALDFPVSLGTYAFPKRPTDPAVLYMLRTPCAPGKPMRVQNRLGRLDLVQTPFSQFEREIRDQLGRMLGGGGFDPARDIRAITVNRWAHGYAFGYSSLWDPDWEEGQEPWVIGRAPFGRITIANSDSGGDADTGVAITQGWRAVQELEENDED